MHFGIGSFNLEITRYMIALELGKLFCVCLTHEPREGRPFFDAYWHGISQGTRSWTINVGPIEVSGSILWMSSQAAQEGMPSI